MALPSEITANEKRTIAADEDPATYTFFFSDLDAYRHVNTVKYVMLLLNQYSLREHDEYAVRQPAREKMLLLIFFCGISRHILR